MENKTEAEVISDLTIQSLNASTIDINSMPYVILKGDDGQYVENMESYLDSPVRKRGNLMLQTAESFIRYVNVHKSDQTNIYADKNEGKFKVVLDDNSKDESGWQDHMAYYTAPKSTEWDTWLRCDQAKMSQTEFALFIERNLPDITDPAAAEMLEISRTLEAKQKVKYSSSIRLQDGQTQLLYNEDIEGATSKGNIKVPEKFTIGIPVFIGGDAYAIEAYLRYRIKDGGLIMWYELIRSHKIFEDAFNTAFKQIEEGTELQIFCASI